MKIKIQFFTYWHCGAGSSGGSRVDALVAKDNNELPYVPGKTLKGHIREIAESLGDADFINRCFGKASTEGGDNEKRYEGKCHFANAVLKEEIDPELAPYLYRTIASTEVNQKSIAETGSLREIEVVVPLTLYAAIENCSDTDAPKMENSFRQVKRIGLNRTRGLGRCEITTAGEAE